MQKLNTGTSIAEAIILTLIITLGIFGMYNIFSSSMKLSNTTQNRIQAIGIAREGIEAVTNIRDTNWRNFSANNTNCWNTPNYDVSCITNADINIATGSYIIFQDNSSRWNLASHPSRSYLSGSYRDDFGIRLDANGLYTQTGGTTFSGTLFTREIQISYPSDAGNPPQKMNVKSLVQWLDNTTNSPQKVEIETVLTNWKK